MRTARNINYLKPALSPEEQGFINALKSMGFQSVVQKDDEGRFTDPTYLTNGYYFAEIHDDLAIYVWHDPYEVLYMRP